MAENKKTSIGGRSTCHLLNIKEPERTAKRLKLSFQRIRASVSQANGGKQDASLTMIDISETGVGVFTEKLLSKGSTVEFSVSEPKPLQLKAVVAWSIPVASGIMMRRYPFRSGLQFLFENDSQRAAVMEFIQRTKLSTSEAAKQQPAPAAADTPPNLDAPTLTEAPAAPVAEASGTSEPQPEATQTEDSENKAA